jgi:hypothetical protein
MPQPAHEIDTVLFMIDRVIAAAVHPLTACMQGRMGAWGRYVISIQQVKEADPIARIDRKAGASRPSSVPAGAGRRNLDAACAAQVLQRCLHALTLRRTHAIDCRCPRSSSPLSFERSLSTCAHFFVVVDTEEVA